MGCLVIKDIYLLVEGGEVSEAAVARDIDSRVRDNEIEIGLQEFASSPAVSTCVGHKAPELIDAFFAAERQRCVNHLCLLFTRERTDDTVPLCCVPDGFLGVF